MKLSKSQRAEVAFRALSKRVAALEGKREQSSDAAECLVRCLYLYVGYTVTSRGPMGCIMDALKIIASDVHDDLLKNDASAVHQLRWGDRT
jgi:hypothetical protein